ncbi:Hypothetical protein A7982_11639 [Minicystis rosea]|nr:Hypothetical protein A7982_11639 [Minicystis rosea]
MLATSNYLWVSRDALPVKQHARPHRRIAERTWKQGFSAARLIADANGQSNVKQINHQQSTLDHHSGKR